MSDLANYHLRLPMFLLLLLLFFLSFFTSDLSAASSSIGRVFPDPYDLRR